MMFDEFHMIEMIGTEIVMSWASLHIIFGFKVTNMISESVLLAYWLWYLITSHFAKMQTQKRSFFGNCKTQKEMTQRSLFLHIIILGWPVCLMLWEQRIRRVSLVKRMLIERGETQKVDNKISL